jgi:hypothetical protein
MNNKMSEIEETLTTSFPLFDLLTEKSKDIALTQQEVMEFMQNVKKLDKNGYELIFVIIRIYSIKNMPNVSINEIPYSGQKLEQNKTPNMSAVKFDIRNFPNKLNQMLYEFTKLHLSKE